MIAHSRLTPVRWMLPVLPLVLFGCTKTIPVEQQPYTERVSIESLLEPGTIPKVYLNRTVPFFTNDQTPSSLFIQDADVRIASPNGVDVLRPDSTYNGFDCRWEPFYVGTTTIVENTTYALHLSYQGRTYTATATTNLSTVQIESTDYVPEFQDIYGGHEGIIVNFTDIPGQTNQYRFIMTRPLDNTHETVDDREYRSTCLADGETVEVVEIGRFVYFDANLDGAPVRFVVEPAYTARKDDEGLIYIQSLDTATAEFYDTLDLQREANINPFVEPVFLNSNVEGAIGIFGAVARSVPVRFVFPQDAL